MTGTAGRIQPDRRASGFGGMRLQLEAAAIFGVAIR